MKRKIGIISGIILIGIGFVDSDNGLFYIAIGMIIIGWLDIG